MVELRDQIGARQPLSPSNRSLRISEVLVLDIEVPVVCLRYLHMALGFRGSCTISSGEV